MAFALAGLALAGLWPAGAAAATPEKLLQVPRGSTALGSGAGQLSNPRDAVAESERGHVYLSEFNNRRISEFTAWGEFVKAWGWDVAPGAVDEEQEVWVRASAGQFRLSFEGEESEDIEHAAGAAAVEAALEALPTVSAGGGGVTVSGGAGTDMRVYVVRFDAGPLAGVDVEQLTVSDGTTPLAGGTPGPEASVFTRANGTAGGTGLEACTTASGCQTGSAGNGAGQLSSPLGLTIDDEGAIYVFEGPLSGESRRVQKFSPAGEFLWMAGGEVNKTKAAEGGSTEAERNLCTSAQLEAGDVCGAGVAGGGEAQFDNDSVRNFVAYSPTADALLVGDAGRIQELSTDGAYLDEIAFAGELEDLTGKTASALAVDGEGSIYLALSATPGVFKLSATGALADDPYPLDVRNPIALESGFGGLCVIEGDAGGGLFPPDEVLCFETDGSPVEGMEPGDEFARPPGDIELFGLGTNLCANSEPPGNLFVTAFRGGQIAYYDGYGTPPIGCEPPPVNPPQIDEGDEFAVAVELDSASVRARINPRFWPDASFYVQYGTAACPQSGWEGAACKAAPAPPGKSLTTRSVDAEVLAPAFLGGLAPGTTYHFRFVAESGGGKTVGAGSSFTTFAAPTPAAPCGNEDRRAGPGAELPDCRAYEMVSPLEKGNSDVLSPFVTGLHQSTPGGERITYSSATAFADPESSTSTTQFLAERGAGGWGSEAIMAPRSRMLPKAGIGQKLQNEFKLFSPDLCDAWLRSAFDPPLTADAIPGTFNLYRRDNCGPTSYEALTTVAPPQTDITAYGALEVQGVSSDGSRAVFIAQDKLTEGAPANPDARLQLYEREAGTGEMRFTCILPDGNPIDSSNETCYAGTADEFFGDGKLGSFENAISADGQRVFWSARTVQAAISVGPGRIFVRVNPELGIDGEVGEGTVAISQDGVNARFWGAAESGERAIYQVEDGTSPLDDELYSFDVDTETRTLIAPQTVGVMGASEDARRVYFASRAVLPDSGQNGEGDLAESGEPNLYLWEEGAGTTFVGTFSEEDLAVFGLPSPVTVSPQARTARVTPDGLRAAFVSTAPMTGFDNIDAVEDRPATEVFVYDAAAGDLRCASCNPTGVRPTGHELRGIGGGGTGVMAAAQIPGADSAYYTSRLLSDDGRRLFFESHEALVPRDTNNRQDVYQWERAGIGSCQASDASFGAEAGGCVDLVTSGESAQDAQVIDASASGNDVFFSTLSSLVPPDFGLIDIYDARVGGGFLYPVPEPPCEGEACQSPPAPPPVTTPSSSGYNGPGNQPPAAKGKRRCGKGKRQVRRAGKVRCVKKSKGKKERKQARKGGNRG